MEARPSVRNSSATPIRLFHIGSAEVQTSEGKLYLFLVFDQTAEYAVAQLVATADRKTAREFFQNMLEDVP